MTQDWPGHGMGEAEATRVEVEAEPRWEQQTLRVDGRATVPDGAMMSWQVTHALHPSFCEDGVAEVTDGRFTFTVDTGEWPHGDVEVWVAFQTVPMTGASQPDAVIARYGRKGEHITGDQVVDAGVLRRAELVVAA